MSINYSLWRDQQIRGSSDNSVIILQQEQIMLDFLASCPGAVWKWCGDNTSFKELCSNLFKISDTNFNSIIIFGEVLTHLTTSQLTKQVSELISSVKYAYVGINRYEIKQHDLSYELPDRIDDSIDTIMKSIDPRFTRLHTFNEVDGNNMVAAHPMDCYGLCK